MAITFSQKQKRQSYLALLFLILIILIFILIRQGYFAKVKITAPPEAIPELPKIEINYEALKNPILKDLQLFDDIKPFEGEAGRENPFVPY